MKESLERPYISFDIEEGDKFTHIKMLENGKQIGGAVIQKHEPGETVFLDNLEIIESKRNQKFGSSLLDEVCRFLDDKNYACYVRNDIQEDEKESMYSKRGWTIKRGFFFYRPQNKT
jgi:bifunctional DNA-binding transcriptional regulator/antitoxin component of YhaV-PrlF toxin-antitoxin module